MDAAVCRGPSPGPYRHRAYRGRDTAFDPSPSSGLVRLSRSASSRRLLRGIGCGNGTPMDRAVRIASASDAGFAGPETPLGACAVRSCHPTPTPALVEPKRVPLWALSERSEE